MASQAITKGPLWMQNVDYPASWDRTVFDVLFSTEGVVYGFDVTPTTGLGIAVSPGAAVIEGDEVAGQGKYLVDSASTINLTIASVGAARVEYVYLAVNDPSVAGGRAGDNATIETSSSAPGDSAILLATISLTTGAATITPAMMNDERTFARGAPGTVGAEQLVDGAVGVDQLGDNAVTLAAMAPDSVGSNEIIDSSVGSAELANGSVNSQHYVDGSIDRVHLAGDVIDSSKLADDSVNSEHYVDGSIDRVHLAGDVIDSSKLADNSVNSEHYVDGSVDEVHLSDSLASELSVGGLTGWGGTCYYWKVGNMVTFQYASASRGGNAASDHAFVLPAGYRPKRETPFAGVIGTGASVGYLETGGVMSLDAFPSGTAVFGGSFVIN